DTGANDNCIIFFAHDIRLLFKPFILYQFVIRLLGYLLHYKNHQQIGSPSYSGYHKYVPFQMRKLSECIRDR
ncbi:MAG: hypothetical protein KJO26_00945, partial [Deltaproteobacteria bacterium]|nr:hypothetical protein [Deltaproteobacteria bacterium]